MFDVTVRAIKNGESVSLLLAHGADPAVQDNQVYIITKALTVSVYSKSFGMTWSDSTPLAVEAQACHDSVHSQS